MVKQRRVAILAAYWVDLDRQIVKGVGNFVRENPHWTPYVPTDRRYLASLFRRWSGDGILSLLDDPEVFKIVSKTDIPVVGFGSSESSRNSKIPCFTSDDVAIARMGAAHFLDRGFRHFAFCGVSRATYSAPWSDTRCHAFAENIKQAGFECSVFAETPTCSDWEVLLEKLSAWILTLPKPVGLMAAYDGRALCVLEACHSLGIGVPEEVAVLGVDNEALICDLANPPLSSVAQSGTRMGYEAAALLDRIMNGESVEPQYFAFPPVGVVTRQSTDILAIDDNELAIALRFIREHAYEGISVNDVVQQVSIARYTLDTRFKNALNRTIHAEIQRVQIERVKELLRTTNLSIQQIAERSGFKYREYLSNLFHHITGQTLGAYREEVSVSSG